MSSLLQWNNSEYSGIEIENENEMEMLHLRNENVEPNKMCKRHLNKFSGEKWKTTN